MAEQQQPDGREGEVGHVEIIVLSVGLLDHNLVEVVEGDSNI